MSLTAAECGDVYKNVLDNALRHKRIAKLLATEKEYANAISHLILGSEELLKAFVLYMESHELRLRQIKGFHKLFYHHKARHHVFKDLLSVWLLTRPLAKGFPSLNKPKANNKVSRFLDNIMVALDVVQVGLSGLQNYYYWLEADKIKQNGFYVDFQDRVCSPADFVQNDFLTASQQIDILYTDIEEFINTLNNMSAEERSEFLILIEKADFAELLEGTIAGKHKLPPPFPER